MNYYQENQAAFLDGLKTFLRIPSISTLSEHKPDIRRAAEFVLNELTAAGLTGPKSKNRGASRGAIKSRCWRNSGVPYHIPPFCYPG